MKYLVGANSSLHAEFFRKFGVTHRVLPFGRPIRPVKDHKNRPAQWASTSAVHFFRIHTPDKRGRSHRSTTQHRSALVRAPVSVLRYIRENSFLFPIDMKFSSCYNKVNMKKTSFIVEVIVSCIFTNPCSVPDMANIRNAFCQRTNSTIIGHPCPITIHSILNCSPCLTPNSPFSSKNYRTIALTLSVLSATLLFAAACVSA